MTALKQSARSAPSLRRSLPWRRLAGLARPARWLLAAMLALSIAGSLAGTLQVVALGRLVDGLAATRGLAPAAGWAAALAATVVCGAVAYALSDVLYAAAAARIFRDLRVAMARGLRRGPGQEGIVTRFVSDVEQVEGVLVGALDRGTMAVFELLAGLVAIGLLVPLAAGVAVGAVALVAVVSRLCQRSLGEASTARQEALESLAAEVEALREEPTLEGAPAAWGPERLPAAELLRARDVALAAAQALAGYGSYAAAGLVPLAVVLAGDGWSLRRAGTVLSLYLLTERAARAGEALIDLGIGVEQVRGPLSRCLSLADGPAPSRGRSTPDAGTATPEAALRRTP